MLRLSRRIRFPVSIAGIALFLSIPALVLAFMAQRGTLRSADSNSSLHSVIARMNLLQSFRGDPRRDPPRLWRERLGMKLASDLWSRQGRGLWWQAWSDDGAGYLILPSRLWPSKTSSRLAEVHLGGIVVIGVDGLHRQQLLKILDGGISEPISKEQRLQRFCLSQLLHKPAVMWSAEGLAAISGSLAPLLQVARVGC